MKRILSERVVIVYGRRGVGKTPVTEALQAWTGGRIVEWNGKDALQPGDIVETHISPPLEVEGALYIEVKSEI